MHDIIYAPTGGPRLHERAWASRPQDDEAISPLRRPRVWGVEDLSFPHGPHFRSALEAQPAICRAIAAGALFSVGGNQFMVSWVSKDYRTGYLKPMGLSAVEKRNCALEKELAATLRRARLRDQLTWTIDGDQLQRDAAVAVGDNSERAVLKAGQGLLRVQGVADSLRFRIHPDDSGRPRWVAVDIGKDSAWARVRKFMHALFRTASYRRAKEERENTLQRLTRTLPPDAMHSFNRQPSLAPQAAVAAESDPGSPHIGPVGTEPASSLAQTTAAALSDRPVRRPFYVLEVDGALMANTQFSVGQLGSILHEIAATTPPALPLPPALPVPPVGVRDAGAGHGIGLAVKAISRRWPLLRVNSRLAQQVLLWHPALAAPAAQALADKWDDLMSRGIDAGSSTDTEPRQTPSADQFTDLIARLGEAAEFKDTVQRLKPGNALTLDDHQKIARVQKILGAIHEDESIRQRCFALADEGLHRCGDRVALYFSYIEAECRIHEIPQRGGNPGDSYLELGRQMFRQAKMEEAFAAWATDHVPVDPVESRLHFQKACQSRGLELPVSIAEVKYGADIPDDVADRAVRHIRTAEGDVNQLAEYFVQLEFWSRHLEQNYASAFEQATAELEGDLNALGVLEMIAQRQPVEPEYMELTRDKDVAYFYRKYPQICAFGQPPQLTSAQCRLVRAQIHQIEMKAVSTQVCKALTLRLLGQQRSDAPARGLP